MVELKVYRCDRCGKVFYVAVGQQPTRIAGNDLCEDCHTSLELFMKYHRDFDKLAEKVAEREFKER